MPDEPVETVTPEAPPQPVPTPTPTTGVLGEGGKAALDAERKAKREAEKRAKEAEDRLRVIEDSQKSDLEKAQSRTAELEKQYAASEAQRLRLHVAAEHGVSKDDLVLLTAATEDELTVQAKRIAEIRGATAAATAPPPFASNPGQAAGNGAPPATATVAAGADLYRQHKATKNIPF